MSQKTNEKRYASKWIFQLYAGTKASMALIPIILHGFMPRSASRRASIANTIPLIPQVGTDIAEKGQIAAAVALKYDAGSVTHIGLNRAITSQFPSR